MNGIQVCYYEHKIFSQFKFKHVQKTDGRQTHHESVFHEGWKAYYDRSYIWGGEIKQMWFKDWCHHGTEGPIHSVIAVIQIVSQFWNPWHHASVLDVRKTLTNSWSLPTEDVRCQLHWAHDFLQAIDTTWSILAVMGVCILNFLIVGLLAMGLNISGLIGGQW